MSGKELPTEREVKYTMPSPCPFCGNKEVEHRERKRDCYPQIVEKTRVYVCPECPFIGLEYYDDNDIINLRELIK